LAAAKSLLIIIQYDTFNTSTFQRELHYGRLQQIISVEFPMGNSDLRLNRGSTFSFALFHQCMLTQKYSRLCDLNIHFYSEENENLQISDTSCVHSLVGRIRDGQSWAIVDRSGGFSREAYLINELD